MFGLRIAPIALLIASLLAIGAPLAGGPVLGAFAQSVGDPADQLIAGAAQKMLDCNTMKFDLVYEQGSTKLYTGIKMTQAKGQIERPGKLSAVVKTKVGFVKVDVKATVIGDTAWVRAVGISEDYTLPSDLAHIIQDPVLLLPDVAGAVENPVVTKVETTKKGQTITWVSGTFNPALIQDEAVRGYAESLGTRQVDVAIDEDGQIASVRLAGQFVSQDSSDVVRRLDIYDCNEPVTIEQP